jgi:hypothetical protein
VAQIDHLIQAVAEKVTGHGAAFKNSQKTGSIEYLFESFDHPDSPISLAFMRAAGVLQWRPINFSFKNSTVLVIAKMWHFCLGKKQCIKLGICDQ